MATLVSDSFNRADSTTTLGNADTGQAWIPSISNIYGISSNKAYIADNTSASLVIAIVPAGTADVKITCSVTTSTTNTNHGLWARATDVDNGIRLHLTNAGATVQLDLYKYTAGSATALQISAGSIALATTYLVEWTMSGPLHVVKIDGVERINVSDATHQTVTYHGLAHDSAGGAVDSGEGRWEDFLIEDLLGAPTLSVFRF